MSKTAPSPVALPPIAPPAEPFAEAFARVAASALSATALGDIAQSEALLAEQPRLLSQIIDCSNPDRPRSMLDAALDANRFALALRLIARGAWCSPPGRRRHPAPFEGTTPRLWERIAASGMDAPLLEMATRALEASGRPAPGWDGWLALKLDADLYAQACEICDWSAAKPSLASIRRLCKSALASDDPGGEDRPSKTSPFWRAMDATAADRHALWRVLFSSDEPLPEAFVERLWLRSARKGRSAAIERLMARGEFPASWSPRGSENAGSVAGAAFAANHVELGSMLMSIPASAAAAIANPPLPLMLAECSIASLSSLGKHGIPLSGLDLLGRNILHLWAKNDRHLPRQGWKTLAKIIPDALFQPDLAGLTPVALQSSLLADHPDRLNEFQAMVAEIERGHIAAPLAKSPPPKPTPNRRAL